MTKYDQNLQILPELGQDHCLGALPVIEWVYGRVVAQVSGSAGASRTNDAADARRGGAGSGGSHQLFFRVAGGVRRAPPRRAAERGAEERRYLHPHRGGAARAAIRGSAVE